MGKPIPYDLRVKIVRDHESGRTQNAIAEEIGCSKDAVKKLLRQYRQKGEAALKADYSKCGKSSRHHFSAEIEAEVMPNSFANLLLLASFWRSIASVI